MNRNSFFKFTTSQRSGVFLFLIIIVVLQTVYFFVDFTEKKIDTSEEKEWLSLQKEVDSLKLIKERKDLETHTFNPNFITDFKGYRLGMTVSEIDRLLEFRKKNKYINSAKEFQQITQVSDSLLSVLSPLFVFPDWINKRDNKKHDSSFFEAKREKQIEITDINRATQEDLMKVYGIGVALSERIIKQRALFGAFVDMEQIKDVWGLSSEVIDNLNKYFNILEEPDIKKININNASIKELSKFPYFKYALAKEIVIYRSMNNSIVSIDELTKINDFPVDKIKIISLYLEL